MVRARPDELHRPRPEPSVGGAVERGERSSRPAGYGWRRDAAQTAARVPLAGSDTASDGGLRPYCVGAGDGDGEAGVPGTAGCSWLQLRGPLAGPRADVLQ